MRVKGTDNLKAEIEPIVQGCRLTYKLRWRCVHPVDEVEIMNGEVICHSCDNRDMTGEQEVEILESYADAREAVNIDEVMQA